MTLPVLTEQECQRKYLEWLYQVPVRYRIKEYTESIGEGPYQWTSIGYRFERQ